MADEMKVEFGAHAEGLIGAMTQIRFALEGLTNPIRAVRNNLGEVAEAFLAAFAVERVAEWVEKFSDLGEQVEHATHELGMSAQQVVALEAGFKLMGQGSDQAVQALTRLERNMTEAQTNANGPAAQSFRALGISMSDLQRLSPEQMLNRLADAFAKTADGPNKTAIAIDLLGRAGAEMIPWLDKGREGLLEFQRVSDETGYSLLADLSESMDQTATRIHTLGMAFEGVSFTIYQDLEPAFDAVISGTTQVVESFNNAARTSTTINTSLRALGLTFRTIGVAAVVAADVTGGAWAILKGSIDAVVLSIAASMKTMWDALHFDWDAVKQDWQHGLEGLNKIAKQSFDDVIKHAHAAAEEIKHAFDPSAPGGEPVPGNKPQAPNPAKFQLGASPEIMQQYRSDLIELQSAQQNYFASTKDMEQSFWAERLALAEQGKAEINGKIVDIKQYYIDNGEQEVQAARKVAEMKIQLEQQVYGQRRAAASAWLSEYMDGLNTQLADLKNQLATKGISEQQWYEQSIQLENDRIQILRQLGLQDTSAYQQAVRQRMNTDKQLIADEERQWKQFANTISSAFDSSLRGMLQGTETFAQGMKQMMGNLILDWIEKFAKAKIEWVGTQIAMALANDEKNASITASDAAAAAAKSAVGAAAHAEDKKSILSDAAVAFGNVYKWVSAIPYVGPVLAPPAAAAAYAAVVAMDTLIPSAAGGMVVPDDTLAMVHKNEMVLPVHLSQGIQGIIGGGSNTIGGGGVVNVNFNINALDAAGVSNLLKVQGPTIAKVIQEQVRQNNQNFNQTAKKASGR